MPAYIYIFSYVLMYTPGSDVFMLTHAYINQSKVLTKPHTGKEKPHPSTATKGGKLCVTKCRRLGV